MLLWIRHRWRLWGLTREKQRVQKTTSKQFREVQAAGTLAVNNMKIFDEIHRQRMQVEEEITGEIVSYLFELAYRYRVSTPNFAELELWETSMYTGRRQLTEKALADFKAAIRNEQKERWQFWELKAKVVGALFGWLTGAIGALIGLIAIWKK